MLPLGSRRQTAWLLRVRFGSATTPCRGQHILQTQPYIRSVVAHLGYHESMQNNGGASKVAMKAEDEPNPRSDPLLETIAQTIAGQGLLPSGSTVVVAVSGGADSVALLHALHELAPGQRWRLHVAHVNHQLRGAESDADAAFVAEFATQAGLPCTVESIDVARAQRTQSSPENTARRLRYRLLAGIARTVGARFIALAHHQDDQAETVLLHLLRGSGLGGLAGMRYASPLLLADDAAPTPGNATSTDNGCREARNPTDPTITLVRPLLNVARTDLRAYCARKGLAFREDSSNETATPQRNWLRHEVLPLLETRYPAVARTLARAAHVLAEDHAYLAETAEDWLNRHARECADGVLLAHAAWRALPSALQSAVLRCAVGRVAGGVQGLEHAHVANARDVLREGKSGVTASLPGGLLCRAEHDGIWLGYAPAPESFAPVTLAIPGRTEIAPLGYAIHAALVEPGSVDFSAKVSDDDAWLDAGQAAGPLTVRTRRPGDRFAPLGMTGEKKLQDFLVDARVPARLRDRVPLVVTEDDRIVWVAGHRIDARFRIMDTTRQALHLRLATLPAEELP